MITIDTQPKSPPHVWRLNTGRTRQFAVIESDHLLLTTPDKTADRIHRLPLQNISRIYIAREKPEYRYQVLVVLSLLAIVTLPFWGPGHLNGFYRNGVAPVFAIPAGLIAIAGFYLSLLPKTLIYIVGGPQPWGVRVRLRRRKVTEFIDALSAGIVRCRQVAVSASGTQREKIAGLHVFNRARENPAADAQPSPFPPN